MGKQTKIRARKARTVDTLLREILKTRKQEKKWDIIQDLQAGMGLEEIASRLEAYPDSTDRELYELLRAADNRKEFRQDLLTVVRKVGKRAFRDGDFRNAMYRLLTAPYLRLKPLSSWDPAGKRGMFFLRDLTQHLFFAYRETPLIVGFYTREQDELSRELFDIYVEGRKVNKHKRLNPFFVRRMVHAWLHAPGTLSLSQAVLHAWAETLGCDRKMVRTFLDAGIPMDCLLDNGSFWSLFLEWCAKQEAGVKAQFGELLKYVACHRFNLNIEMGFENSHYHDIHWTLKEKTVRNVMIELYEWQARVDRQPTVQFEWAGMDQPDWCPGDVPTPLGEAKEVRVMQIRDSDRLYLEGKEQKHCVATYLDQCLDGTCAIWSLSYIRPCGKQVRTTIEVNIERKSVEQAEDKDNENPGFLTGFVLKTWTRKVKLRIDSCVSFSIDNE